MKRIGNNSVVTEPVRLDYVDRTGRRGSLTATLRYDAADPFAMSIRFAGPRAVTWTFGRELLIAGMHAPTGDGDVRVTPASDGASEGAFAVHIDLSSPDGQLLLSAPMRETTRFVRRMLECVPLGDEATRLDLDATIRGLLGRARQA